MVLQNSRLVVRLLSQGFVFVFVFVLFQFAVFRERWSDSRIPDRRSFQTFPKSPSRFREFDFHSRNTFAVAAIFSATDLIEISGSAHLKRELFDLRLE